MTFLRYNRTKLHFAFQLCFIKKFGKSQEHAMRQSFLIIEKNVVRPSLPSTLKSIPSTCPQRNDENTYKSADFSCLF